MYRGSTIVLGSQQSTANVCSVCVFAALVTRRNLLLCSTIIETVLDCVLRQTEICTGSAMATYLLLAWPDLAAEPLAVVVDKDGLCT